MLLPAGVTEKIDLASTLMHPQADFSLLPWPHLLKVAAVLCGLLGLLLLWKWWWQRGGVPRPNRTHLIHILETRPLGPKLALVLVEIERQRFLLAQTGETLKLLAPLSAADDRAPDKTQPASASAPLALAVGGKEHA